MKNNKKDFILEIGTEELPVSVIKKVHCTKNMQQLPDGTKLFPGDIPLKGYACYATPRRILICLKGVPDFHFKTFDGPPRRIAYDSSGKPTKALLGFLNKINAKEKDISEVPSGDNDKVQVKIKFAISSAINEYVAFFSEQFEPKKLKDKYIPDFNENSKQFQTMAWDDSGVRFPRPIRWILALHGDKIMPVKIGDIKAGNITYGNLIDSEKPITVKNARGFLAKLENGDDINNVIYNYNTRIEEIKKHLEKKHWHKNIQLLEEVAGLVEYPEFIEGIFDKEYLKLPQEVLVASMSKNQRIFPLEDKNGKLINKFVAVVNGNTRNLKQIKYHYEQVLDAKLKDALFFYNEDLKKPLSDRAGQLNGIIFHKKLGSYADKVERLIKLVNSLKDTLKITDKESEKLIQACRLCKADLLTEMVGEFPSLQGVTGKYYALKEGIDEEVAQAIEEHYRPRFSEDKLPQSKLAIVLALLDRLDSVICHFKAGHQPKGNWDLYALRRQSIGIIKIILKNKVELCLPDIFDKVFKISPGDVKKENLKCEFMAFMQDRLYVVMSLEHKYRHDLINSVLSPGFDNIYKFYLRLSSLNNIIGEFCFEQARQVVERTNNITKNVSGFAQTIDPSLFEFQEEKTLFENYNNIKDKIPKLMAQDNYAQATELYGSSLADVTHEFFDKVMVNVDDEKLRNNRLKLLKDINSLYTKDIADLSKIVTTEKEKKW